MKYPTDYLAEMDIEQQLHGRNVQMHVVAAFPTLREAKLYAEEVVADDSFEVVDRVCITEARHYPHMISTAWECGLKMDAEDFAWTTDYREWRKYQDADGNIGK